MEPGHNSHLKRGLERHKPTQAQGLTKEGSEENHEVETIIVGCLIEIAKVANMGYYYAKRSGRKKDCRRYGEIRAKAARTLRLITEENVRSH